MPKISQSKKDKICEQILHYLFTVSPESRFTVDIAREIARDEEFTKSLLLSLQEKKAVIQINKNFKGQDYSKRQRWRLSNEAFDVYKRHQSTSRNSINHNNIYNDL
ncbi:MAG: hypothetical protein Q8Q31_01560 [Nanoarchaeota archaeon]|nr:hypothetical protein [Nanoarchaeota archaeon]